MVLFGRYQSQCCGSLHRLDPSLFSAINKFRRYTLSSIKDSLHILLLFSTNMAMTETDMAMYKISL